MISAMESRKFYYLGFPIVLFLIIPGFIINENLNDLLFLDTSLLILLGSAACMSLTAVLFLVDFLMDGRRLRNYFSSLIRVAFFLVLISGLFLPVSLSVGMVDPISNPVNVTNIVLTLIISLLLYSITFSRIKNGVFVGILTILVINAFAAVSGIFSLREAAEVESKNTDTFEVSNSKNVFVISLDGLPREISLEVIKKSQIFQRDFVDFVAFENVISSSPATMASIFAELSGNQNFKEKAKTIDKLVAVNPELLTTNYLDTHGFNVSTFSNYARSFKDTKRIIVARQIYDLSLKDRVLGILTFYDNVFVRVGTQYSVRLLAKLYRVSELHAIIDRIASFFGKHDKSSIFEKVNLSFGSHWDKVSILEKLVFDGYIDRLHVSDANAVAHFLHFGHTHFPVDFDFECEFKSNDAEWYNTHQNKNGVEAEVHCALSQMASFIKRLKDLGVYDQSLIVLKSDHGKPVSYYNPNNTESFKIRNHSHWGYGRYTPLLLIKNFHSNFKEMQYNQSAVMLDDLARTLCIHSGIEADCSVYPGYDLLSKNLEVPVTASSVIFVVENENSSHKYDTHKALHLKRKKDFYENINSTLTSEILSTSLVCGSKINFDNSKRYNNGFSDYKSWVTWRNHNSYFIKFNLEQCSSGVEINLKLEKFNGGSADFKVFVNDKIIPVGLQEITSQREELLGNANYQITIKPEFLGESGSTVLQVSPVDEDAEVALIFLGIDFEK